MISSSRKKGYTLLEVLIATLLFSMIVFLSTFALNQSLKQYQSLIERGLNFWEDAKILWLQKSLSSAFDYYVYDERRRLWFPLFLGRLDKMVYTSLSPFSNDLPVLVILEKTTLDEKEALIYYEAPLYTLNYKEIEKILNFREYRNFTSFVFFQGLDELKFKYYGYDRVKKFYDWFSEYDSANSFYLPAVVKIEFSKEGVGDALYGIINVQNLRKVYYNEFYQR